MVAAMVTAGLLGIAPGRHISGAAAPLVQVSPSSGPAGSTVTISGSGFAPGQAVRLAWAGSTAGMPAVGGGRGGVFSVAVPVPALAAGTYTVSARVDGAAAASASFTITEGALAPTPAPSTPAPVARRGAGATGGATGATSTPTPVRTRYVDTSGTPSPAGASGIYLGVWQPGAPADMAQISRFEARANKKVAIVNYFWSWTQRLDPALLNNVDQHGSVSMLTWAPTVPNATDADKRSHTFATIAAGDSDAYIQSWARQLAAFNKPVLIRFAHEMNLPATPWGKDLPGNGPTDYVSAWRHIHDIFVREGATNVQWVWCPNVFWNPETDFTPFFPGDQYVDWVALDGYNWGGGNWMTFDQLFRPSYDRITALSTRPVMLAEISSAEAGDGGAMKAAWITDLLNAELPTMPRIKALMWFNEDWNGGDRMYDFRVESSPASQSAFAASVAGPYYLSSMR